MDKTSTHGVPAVFLFRRNALARTGLLLCGLAFAGQALAQPSRWTVEAWREDLDFLRLQIGARHGNPYHAADGEGLAEAFGRLRESIPRRTDFEIAFEIQRILALLGDGHSWLSFTGEDLARHFPFDAWTFDDGLFITRAKAGYDRAVGKRVVEIEGVPIEEIQARLAPYISRDNDMDLPRQTPLMIRIAPVLHAIGMAPQPDEATFTLEDSAGIRTTQRFRGIPLDDFLPWYRDDEAPASAPLYRQKKEESYWHQTLPEEQAVYFQFNRFVEKRKGAWPEFLDGLFGQIEDNPESCLIIDLRRNGDGYISMVEPLAARIRKHPRLTGPGYLYVITGRDTFSAALMLCMRLERHTGVIFAGEPGRGKPNSYSELGAFTLPNTELRGSLSIVYHEEADPLDPRDRVEVDLPAPLTYADYAAGRDPAMERVLEHWRGIRSGLASDERK